MIRFLWAVSAVAAVTSLVLAIAAVVVAHASLIDPACPNATSANVPNVEKRAAFRCLLRYARAHQGLSRVAGSRLLHRAAVRKGQDVRSCGFSHTACGRDMAYWPRALGYCRAGTWAIGEDLARGYDTAEDVMRAWLASPSHRAILLSRWTTVGTAIRGSTWVLETGACT